MIVAQLFGAGTATDAFFVAFRIPNLLRRLVGEGSLTVSFIPVYSAYLNQKSKEEIAEFLYASFSVLAVLLLILTASGTLFSPWIVKAIAYGFSQDPEKFRLTVLLNRVMFPYIFFIGLVAWAMGVLNTLRHFTGPALAPVLLNMSIIVCTLGLYRALRRTHPILGHRSSPGGGGPVSLPNSLSPSKGDWAKIPLRPFPPRGQKCRGLMAPFRPGSGRNPVQCHCEHFLGLLPSGGKCLLSLLCRPAAGIPHGDLCHCHRHRCPPSFIRRDGQR